MTAGMAAREAALQMLYALDLDRGQQSVREVEHWYRKAHPLEPAEAAQAQALVAAVEDQREQIESLIGKHAIGWRLERMSVVDRCILKMATAEILRTKGATRKPAIKAALLLSKMFSQPEAAKFLQGLLEAVARDLASALEVVPHGD